MPYPTSYRAPAGFPLKVLTVSILLALIQAAQALPVGGVVNAGSASIAQGPGTLTITQVSPHTI
ncbi:MAG: hypothetical protein Q8M78_14440, partial [Burkholderiaceae bacterium]|nr:hypothetical protein [Burkholderiaceae bacterium]